MITENEFIALSKDIPNEEIPALLSAVLLKVHRHLDQKASSFTESQVIRSNMFKLFFKQFNTVLVLSKKTNYLIDHRIEYLDIKTINITIRSMHELYLVHQYLVSDLVFEGSDDERDFKYTMYKYAGEIDSKRTFSLMQDSKYKPATFEESQQSARHRATDLWNKIVNYPSYSKISPIVRKEIKKGNWRINATKTLSWSDLLDYSPISKKYAQLQYHHMSQYAHMSYGSMVLEANHNEEIDGLLCHLYILTTLFSISVLDSNNEKVDLSGFLTKRELVIVSELTNLAINR